MVTPPMTAASITHVRYSFHDFQLLGGHNGEFSEPRDPTVSHASLMCQCITHEETHLSLLPGTPGASPIAGLLEPVVAGYSFPRPLPQAGFLSSIPPQASVSHITFERQPQGVFALGM